MDESTYSVIRFYEDSSIDRVTIATGLTLQEAQEHCSDAETSSSTATSEEAILHWEEHGSWFDGYREE